MLLRLLSRDYIGAIKILATCQTDSQLSAETKWVLTQFNYSADDMHPNAHAVRLKLTLLVWETMGIGMPSKEKEELSRSTDAVKVAWDVPDDYMQYLKKISHVALECLLTKEEEQELVVSAPRKIAK